MTKNIIFSNELCTSEEEMLVVFLMNEHADHKVSQCGYPFGGYYDHKDMLIGRHVLSLINQGKVKFENGRHIRNLTLTTEGRAIAIDMLHHVAKTTISGDGLFEYVVYYQPTGRDWSR